MQTIWKFPLLLEGRQHAQVPRGYRLLHVAADPQGNISFWAMVDPEAPKESVVFRVVGTGHPVDDRWRHEGSLVQGPFVWHVFTEA